MANINIHEILTRNIYKAIRPNFIEGKEGDESAKIQANWFLICDTSMEDGLKAAIKEIVEAVVDKCAEQAHLSDFAFEFMQEGADGAIVKEDILAVKNQIDYGGK